MKRVASLAEGVEIKVVGKSGQISLGKRYAGRTLRLERRTDGTVVLTAVAMVPETQLWTLEEPHRSRIERGLTWAAATGPRDTVAHAVCLGTKLAAIWACRRGAHDDEAEEHDLPLVQQGRGGGGALLRRHISE